MLDTFYSTAAQICFVLLGLWWLVVQFKHGAWMQVPARRRMAFNVSHYFVLPGIMSLIALLSGNNKFIWQASFILAGAIGAFETVSIISNADVSTLRPQGVRIGGWVQLVLYILVVLFAIDAALGQPIHLGLQPLELEGLCIGLLLFLGVNLAWTLFAEAEGSGQ